MKRLPAGLLAAAVLPLLSVPVSADALPVPDLQRPCSLRISLEDKHRTEPESGAEITLYHAAELVRTDDGFAYRYTEDFSGCTFSLSDPASLELAAALYTFASENGRSGQTAVSDADGAVLFSDLTPGLYLAAETRTPEGFYSFIPFIAVLPVTENGEFLYDITAAPKLGDLETTYMAVRKIWNDDDTGRPDSVTVQILKNGAVAETVTLSESNRWRYAWSVPNDADEWDVREINIPKGYTVSYEKSDAGFTVRNTPEKLIQTGQEKWPIPVLAGGGTLLILLGTALCLSGRSKRDAQ